MRLTLTCDVHRGRMVNRIHIGTYTADTLGNIGPDIEAHVEGPGNADCQLGVNVDEEPHRSDFEREASW